MSWVVCSRLPLSANGSRGTGEGVVCAAAAMCQASPCLPGRVLGQVLAGVGVSRDQMGGRSALPYSQAAWPAPDTSSLHGHWGSCLGQLPREASAQETMQGLGGQLSLPRAAGRTHRVPCAMFRAQSIHVPRISVPILCWMPVYAPAHRWVAFINTVTKTQGDRCEMDHGGLDTASTCLCPKAPNTHG